MARLPSALGALDDDELAAIMLGLVKSTFGDAIGLERTSRLAVAMAAQLMMDVEGEARGWEILRTLLADATERARLAAHPAPRPAP